MRSTITIPNLEIFDDARMFLYVVRLLEISYDTEPVQFLTPNDRRMPVFRRRCETSFLCANYNDIQLQIGNRYGLLFDRYEEYWLINLSYEHLYSHCVIRAVWETTNSIPGVITSPGAITKKNRYNWSKEGF